MLRRVTFAALFICLVAVIVAGQAPQFLASLASVEAHDSSPSLRGAGTPSAERQVRLGPSRGGQVMLDATIEGRSVPMMVDTGASLVTLSNDTAKRLGIAPARADYRLTLRTANGLVQGASIRLRELRIGSVSLENVDAVILPAGALDANLLGMSFLGRLSRFEFRGSELILTQ